MSEPLVTIHSISEDNCNFNYVVIAFVFNGKWVWVRQKDKITWELPGGHVEPLETPDEAAKRELFEETGAVNFNLQPLCDFSVLHNKATSYNRLYFATAEELGSLPNSEIAEIGLFAEIPPHPLTHGSIQLILFEIAKEHYLLNEKLLKR